ncbi:hypothetical protein AB9F29_05780 [Falsihalocynthiibacter sp. S25ZX9]|uniref:hypothetical protein n=1 Tax=Falsihalocynthiibacter sp. S25ZX9 TaxID=3240870 RepID=UPI00351045EB
MSTTAILHVGTPKTGSSTIQRNLFNWRETLMENGILIPEISGRMINQEEILEIFSGKSDGGNAEKLLSKIYNDVQKLCPKYVIFSSEYLFSQSFCAESAKQVLSDLFDDIRVVVYLRDPAGYYLSFNQQKLKATDIIDNPKVWRANYRNRISPWKSEYGNKLDIVPFQASSFPSGLTEDFLSRFAEYKGGNPNPGLSKHFNVSDTGEVTYLMQKYFRYCHPREARSVRKLADFVRRDLNKTSKSENLGRKAVLLPEVQRLILWNSREDLVWLKETEGIEFDAIDYEGLRDLRIESFSSNFDDFNDIVDVSIEHSNEILMKSVQGLAERASQLTSVRAELEKARSDLADALSDINARRSKIAGKIDRFDYEIRYFLANVPFLSERFRSGMRAAADKRRRQCYGK